MPRTPRPERFRDRWRVRWTDHRRVRRSRVFLGWEEADRFLKERLAEVARIKAGVEGAPPVERPFSV